MISRRGGSSSLPPSITHSIPPSLPPFHTLCLGCVQAPFGLPLWDNVIIILHDHQNKQPWIIHVIYYNMQYYCQLNFSTPELNDLLTHLILHVWAGLTASVFHSALGHGNWTQTRPCKECSNYPRKKILEEQIITGKTKHGRLYYRQGRRRGSEHEAAVVRAESR